MVKLSILFKPLYIFADRAALFVSGYTIIEVFAVGTLDLDKLNIFDGNLKSYVLVLTAAWYVYKFIIAIIGWKGRAEEKKKKQKILDLDIEYREMRNGRKDMKLEHKELLKHSDNGSSISDRSHEI